MLDDGGHNDALNGDGLYGAILPAAGNGTVVEFYVQATDTGGRIRTWPAPAWETNNTLGQFANALYQVDNESISNNMPIVRAVMTGTERALFPPSNRNSDASYNLTSSPRKMTGSRSAIAATPASVAPAPARATRSTTASPFPTTTAGTGAPPSI
jgi:hypothetical protein